MNPEICKHDVVTCLNVYDLIRKYRCEACHGVMMCSCDKKIGERFLPHQLKEGPELETGNRVPVTLGFQDKTCRECRGLKPMAHPTAARFRSTSNIRRYYWREIFFRELEIFAELANKRGLPESSFHDPANKEILKVAKAKAIDEVKEMHKINPKYQFDHESEQMFLKRMNISVVEQEANILPGGLVNLPGSESISVELFAKSYYENLDFDVMVCESRPFHALFGVYCYLLVQHHSDPRNRWSGFGERLSYEETGKSTSRVWTTLPADFGTRGYGKRRAEAIEDHLRFLRDDKKDLLWLFDYWVKHSENFRQYLWAHRQEDVQRARRLVEILKPEQIRQVLRYLFENYWQHYLGWPDLIAAKNGRVLFVEVKGSKDKLSDEQRRWIEQNNLRLHFDFELFKVKRKT